MEQTIIEATTMEAQLKEVFEQHSTQKTEAVRKASGADEECRCGLYRVFRFSAQSEI